MSNVRMIPQYDTKLFTEVFDDAGTFVYYYKNIGIPTTISDANARTLYYLLYARYGNSPIANYDEEQFKYKIFSVVFQYGPTWEKRLSVQQTLRDMQLSDLIDNGALNELFSGQGTTSSTSAVNNGNTRTLNTQEANTGTQTTTKTGTQALAHTGSVGTVHDNDISNTGADTTVDNHSYNPSTAPATDAFEALTTINEQRAQQITKGTSSEQDESSTTTYANTDTTTNNLTDQTTNNLTKADTGTITDRGSSSETISGTDSKSHTNTTTMTAGKLKAYEKLLELLDSDVTGEFISKFKICFKQFVMPERTWIYVSEVDDDEE